AGMTAMRARLSILGLAPLGRGETTSDSFATSVALAQRAEDMGYERIWYGEHHNIPAIAPSPTSALIAHVGAQTSTIRLGAGGAPPHVDESLTYTAAGTPSDVRDSLDKLLRLTDADELIFSVHPAPIAEDRLRSIALLAEAAHRGVRLPWLALTPGATADPRE